MLYVGIGTNFGATTSVTGSGSGYQVGAWVFVRWEGTRPQFVRQHVMEYAKPGQDGSGALLHGRWGNRFSAQLSAVFADEASMRLAEEAYRDLIGSLATIIYEGVNFTTAYATNFLVVDVEPLVGKRHAHLCGPGYNYVGGWMLTSNWVFVPRVVS